MLLFSIFVSCDKLFSVHIMKHYILLNICIWIANSKSFEYKEMLVEIEEKLADEEYDELIISGDFNNEVLQRI